MGWVSELILGLASTVTRWVHEKMAKKIRKVTYFGLDQEGQSSKVCDKSQDMVTEEANVSAAKSIPKPISFILRMTAPLRDLTILLYRIFFLLY